VTAYHRITPVSIPELSVSNLDRVLLLASFAVFFSARGGGVALLVYRLGYVPNDRSSVPRGGNDGIFSLRHLV